MSRAEIISGWSLSKWFLRVLRPSYLRTREFLVIIFATFRPKDFAPSTATNRLKKALDFHSYIELVHFCEDISGLKETAVLLDEPDLASVLPLKGNFKRLRSTAPNVTTPNENRTK